MKKVINAFINFLIIILLVVIGYLLYQNYQMKKLEIDNTNSALTTYETVTCSENQVVEDRSHPQVTNATAEANQIIGYIMFPSLGESAALLQGDINDDQVEAMERGVSHDPRSSMPGVAGNTVLAGHRELFFKNFLDLEIGDDVIINLGDNIYIYQIVDYQVIDPEQVDVVFYQNTDDLLVMYTCYPIEAWKYYTQRLVVKAKPVASTTVENCQTVTDAQVI